ncbi:helix-turn-helix domain-containing protein [Acidocella sp. KAb 2-4]|uniref:helix-turn-helix domain-containing protein n=1 Tax=Acidocella sp. KAb 2-4 TaxID=2885158 RepID=UPI001D0962FF|nr:helix-turn-helix transcriptional regulator [Acidocella sp. KAb 2-4]MCB5943935.1 helix-turn-helix domain-containing protein [Acidocella sp. KAb 2-4]
MKTSDKIKAMRRDHGMTQEDLAAKAGCGLATIQRAESGRRLSADSLASIAAAFGIPASELAADAADNFEAYLPLEPIRSGRCLVELLLDSSRIDFGFSELDNLDDAKAIEIFHDFCHALAALERPLSPIVLVSRELETRDHIKALAEKGFCVGGADFEVKVYEVDDDGGGGPAFLLAQWDERRVALRVGRTPDEILRAHVLRTLGQWETPHGTAIIYPPTKHRTEEAEAPDEEEM